MDHLTEEQIEQLEKKLQKLDGDISAALASLEDTSKPVALSEPIGRLSRMDALAQQGLAQESQERLKLRSQLVKQALKRLEDGTYGICVRSGEPIPFARLKVMPESPVSPKS